MAKDCIGIVFGRFNPPHKGHKAAWEMMASECTYWFVGTNKSTLDIRNPLPYEVKKAAMKAILPEVRSHIVPEKTWLTMAANMYKKYGDLPLYCYTDENWVVTLLQKYNNVKDKEGNYYNFSVIEKKPTPRISSASSLRQAVEEDDRNTFFEEAGVSEDFTIINPEDNKSYNYFDLVKKYLTLQEVYMPKKYRAGLSKTTAGKRKKFWIKLGKYPYTKAEYSKAEKVPGDAKSETRPSQYNDKYQQMFGESRSIKALQKKAKATGIPYGILKQVYNRGMAAWVTGHRPGATQSAWAFARVNSFVTKGKTWRTADADLAKKARKYLKEDNGKFVYVKSGYITPSPWIVQLNESNNMTIKQLLTEDQYSIDRLKKYVNDPTYIFSSDTLNRLIDDFPFDGGVVYRGMNFLDQKSYENFVKDIQDGKLKTATLTSWTRDRDTAHQFAITRPTYHFNNILAAAEKVRIDIGDYMIGYRGLILKTRVQPNIALDVNKSGVAAEDEVILPPGTYTVEIESEEIPYKYKFADNQKINNQILSFDKNNFSESQKNLLLFVLKNKSPEDLSAKTKKHIFNLLYESNRNSKLAYDISKKSSFSAIDHRNTVRISMGFNPILLHYINIFDQIDRNKLIKDCDTVLKNIITLLNSKMQEDQIDISVDRVELSPLMSVIIDHASPGMAQKYVNYIKKLVSAKYNELNSSVAQLNKITDRNRKQEEISNFMKKIQNVMNFAKSIIPSTAKVEAFNKVIGDKESLKESNDSSKFSIKPEDLKDALMVLKDWSYEYNVRWNDSIDKIWNNLVKDGYIDSLNVSELKAWRDLGRRPDSEQMKNPIIVGKLMDGNYIILDGQHRLIKAKEIGQNKIKSFVIDLPLSRSTFTKKYVQVDKTISSKTEIQTNTELAKRYFHGTSDVFLRDIENNGLRKKKGRIYLSTIPLTAKVEAFNKVIGDMAYGLTSWPPKPTELARPGVGGKAVIIEIDPKYIDVSKLKVDPEYPSEDEAYYIEYNLPKNSIIKIQTIGKEPPKDVINYLMGLEESELNELNEVFADYLEYDMWGWVTPTGKVILPTKADADSEYEVTHFNILKKYFSRVDAYEKYDAAYESGWIRFLIEDRILYFNCILSDNLPEILTKAKNTIEEYAKNPKKFYYFIGPDAKKATRSFKKDGIGMLSIDSYDLDLKLDRWNEISTKKFNEFKTLYNLNKSSTSFANLITRLNNALSHPEAKKFMFNEKIKEDVTMDHMDYEIEMASSQLKKIADLASNILNYIQNKSELDAWVQDKISVSAHNMEAIYDNYFYNEDKLEENIVNKDKKYYLISKKTGKNLGGPYSSKKKAQERERQVQYFKNK